MRRVRSNRGELLDGIDRGGYARAIEALETTAERLTDVDDALLRAEIALYLDDFEAAGSFLERFPGVDLWLDAEGETGARARRARLLMVEMACFTGELTEAERLVRPLVEAAHRAADAQSELRGLYDSARIARHRAHWTLAIDRLDLALALALEIKNRFYEGRVSYTLGYCWYHLNRLDLAVPHLQRALDALAETENLRFRATVETFYGGVLCDEGKLDTALELLSAAERTGAELGVIGDMVMARVNGARTRLALGQYAEVERALGELLGWERTPGATPIELLTLRLLAITHCVRGQAGEALRSAQEALRLGEVAGNAADVLEARLLVARAESLGGAPGASARLGALVAEVDTDGTPYLQAEARIYYARAMLTTDPIAANTLCEVVRAMPVTASYFWLQRELGFVERDIGSLAVRITPEGHLLMDPQGGWPNLRAAREATERYWFERALTATNGNVSAAARLLGLTRNEAHTLYRMLVKGEPARPTRKKGSDAAAKRPRRRPQPRG